MEETEGTELPAPVPDVAPGQNYFAPEEDVDDFARLEAKVDSLIVSVNSIGEMINYVVQTVAQMGQAMGGKSGLSGLLGLLKGGSSDG